MFVWAPWFLFGKAGCSNSERSGRFGRARRSFLAYFVIFHMAQSKPTWEELQGEFSQLLGKVWSWFAALLFSHPLPHLHVLPGSPWCDSSEWWDRNWSLKYSCFLGAEDSNGNLCFGGSDLAPEAQTDLMSGLRCQPAPLSPVTLGICWPISTKAVRNHSVHLIFFYLGRSFNKMNNFGPDRSDLRD